MRRSLALLQESYCESESDEEENTESSIDNLKDKPQSKVVSCAIKCIDVDEVIHSKNSKSSDHQDDTSNSRMNIIECFDMNISLDDIPLPPDASPKDMLQPELVSYSKLSINSNEKSSIKSNIIDSKSSDHGKDTSGIVIEPPPLSPGAFMNKTHTKSMSPEAIDYLAEGVDEDKMHVLKASKSSPNHQDNPSDSQMPISRVSPLSIDDTLEDKLQFELMPFLKEDVNDENSSSEDLKTPLHEDDSSVSRGTISEESPMSSDDTFKVRLPYELESMCYEGMDDDETTSSEDSKSYDNQDGLAMSSESRSQTALASLHETYTDSEGEIESDAEEENTKEKYLTPSKESTPSSMDDTSKDKPQSKLVSYATEEGMDDDEMSDSEDSKSSSDHQDDSSDSRVYVSEVPPLSPVTFHRKLLNLSKNEIQLPPEPRGRCSKSLQEKISELYEKRKQGKDMNASIQKRKDFRNPSIYEKLIQFCNIDEQGTNYPPETYDPHCWGPESYYEELAKRQKEEMDKREKEKKERTKVEFISGTAKKTASDSIAEGAKRKSKWDIGINQMPAAALKPATLITPTVLPVPTGTKPTVISAFGTISKKAKQ